MSMSNDDFETSTAISAQGTDISMNTGTAAAPVWTEVANVTDFSGFDGAAAEIDVTTLKSKAKEKRVGLQDWSAVNMAIDINLAEPSHQALLAAKKAGTKKMFKATLSDGTEIDFRAFVKSFPIGATVDDVYKGTVALTITGDIEVTLPK